VPEYEKEEEKKVDTKEGKGKVLSLAEFTKELGVGREGVIGSYEAEENPDELKPEDYIEMQRNDGESSGNS